MNTILQKRIEEAAEKIVCSVQCAYFDLDKTCNCYAKKFCIKTAEEVLRNQWISVEEALPEVNELVFGCVNDEGTSQAVGVAYYDEYGGWHYSDEEEISLITHWMPIPSLEGGEK